MADGTARPVACIVCGVEITQPKGSGRIRRYCSKRCHRRSHPYAWKPKAGFLHRILLCRYCKNCGAAMLGSSNKLSKYFGFTCSRTCAIDLQRASARRNFPIELTPRRCLICAVEFQPRRSEQIACSRGCGFVLLGRRRTGSKRPTPPAVVARREQAAVQKAAHIAERKRSAPERALAKYEQSKADARAKTRAAWAVPLICRICGREWLRTATAQTRCSYCTAAATRAMKARDKAKRRARIGLASLIDPVGVFERDGWQCYLCSIATPKELRGTLEPNAPEMDHVKPLAKGGGHSWDNVACACRRCNLIKADKELSLVWTYADGVETRMPLTVARQLDLGGMVCAISTNGGPWEIMQLRL